MLPFIFYLRPIHPGILPCCFCLILSTHTLEAELVAQRMCDATGNLCTGKTCGTVNMTPTRHNSLKAGWLICTRLDGPNLSDALFCSIILPLLAAYLEVPNLLARTYTVSLYELLTSMQGRGSSALATELQSSASGVLHSP